MLCYVKVIWRHKSTAGINFGVWDFQAVLRWNKQDIHMWSLVSTEFQKFTVSIRFRSCVESCWELSQLWPAISCCLAALCLAQFSELVAIRHWNFSFMWSCDEIWLSGLATIVRAVETLRKSHHVWPRQHCYSCELTAAQTAPEVWWRWSRTGLPAGQRWWGCVRQRGIKIPPWGLYDDSCREIGKVTRTNTRVILTKVCFTPKEKPLAISADHNVLGRQTTSTSVTTYMVLCQLHHGLGTYGGVDTRVSTSFAWRKGLVSTP